MAGTTSYPRVLLGLGLLQQLVEGTMTTTMTTTAMGSATTTSRSSRTVAADRTTTSLVPAEAHPGQLSYFTTWSAQGYVYGANDELPLADYVENSTSIAHAVLTAGYAFTAASKLPGAGWADFYPKARIATGRRVIQTPLSIFH